MIRLSATTQVNLAALILAAVLILLALPACGEPPRPAAPVIDQPALPAPPVPTATPAKPATAEDAELRAARVALAQAKARVDAAEAAVREARQEASLAPLRATAVWATWAGGVLALLAGLGWLLACWWQLPIGRKTLAGLALAGLALAAGAQALLAIAPWLMVAGLVLVGLAVAAGVAVVVWRLRGAVRAAADHGDRLESAAIAAGVPLAHLRQQVHQVSAKAKAAPIVQWVRGKRGPR